MQGPSTADDCAQQQEHELACVAAAGLRDAALAVLQAASKISLDQSGTGEESELETLASFSHVMPCKLCSKHSPKRALVHFKECVRAH